MGRNIFVSYKYKDAKVAPLFKNIIENKETIVRHYVDELQEIIGFNHTNLGEKDGESLKDFSEGYIESNLKKKIYRSSITIVMISKGMKDLTKLEKDQWIPWEISYSLRIVRREDTTSQMNAILGIVLPDENNSYDWYFTENTECNCTTHNINSLFDILSSNMFNMKNPIETECNGLKIHHGEFSYIKTVKWIDFKATPNDYLDKVIEIRDNEELYKIKTNLS